MTKNIVTKKSLLEEALDWKNGNKRQLRYEVTPEHIELAIAFLSGEIGLTALQRALKLRSNGTAVYRAFKFLQLAYYQKKLKIV